MLYRALGRIDACFGARSWDEAWTWLKTHDASRPIEEIQYWGHGRWGRVLVDEDVFDARALTEGHPLYEAVLAVRERLLPGSLVWLRTCEAFGATAGLDFSQRLADGLGARVAGHTFIIGALQSGLRTLAPGCRPTWSGLEGLADGTSDHPLRAHRSALERPRTITFLSNEVPRSWFDEDGTPVKSSASG
jgi:hypothetical protein